MGASKRAQSKLFTPMTIGGGRIQLYHRIVHAPLTRNRGTSLAESTMERPNRIWLANDLMVEYYSQRATKGGLMITEGVPPSLEVRTMALCCLEILPLLVNSSVFVASPKAASHTWSSALVDAFTMSTDF